MCSYFTPETSATSVSPFCAFHTGTTSHTHLWLAAPGDSLRREGRRWRQAAISHLPAHIISLAETTLQKKQRRPGVCVCALWAVRGLSCLLLVQFVLSFFHVSLRHFWGGRWEMDRSNREALLSCLYLNLLCTLSARTATPSPPPFLLTAPKTLGTQLSCHLHTHTVTQKGQKEYETRHSHREGRTSVWNL